MTTTVTIIFTALLSAMILYLFIHHYRKLRKCKNRCDTAFKDVELLQDQLISRSAPAIIITQKVFRDEAELFEDIKPLYLPTEGFRSLEDRIHNILLLRNKLTHLRKRAQKDPELKDSDELQTIWVKIEITNRNIDESASYYNDAVHDYKEITSQFPGSMLADILQYPQYHRI